MKKKNISILTLIGFLSVLLTLLASAEEKTEPVTLDNLVRTETDHMIRANIKSFGLELGEIVHQRETVDIENQPVIRMNVDTIYSSLVLDLSKPAEVTLPEIDSRYQSMHVVNQDHYMFVESKPGTYKLTEKKVGSRFASIAFRTFVNPSNPADVKAAHAAQDGIKVSGGGKGPFEAPNWDTETLAVVRKAFNDAASALSFDTRHAFGSKDQVRPVDYVVGAMAGWFGLPAEEALYILDSVVANDGKTPYVVTVKDVPVDAFWSITIYNADGYMEPNELGRNSFNNVTAKPNADGSITIHFGGDPESINYLPITEGWNYAIRMYQPRKEILEGEWTFPAIEPVK